ncbi:hypothetical protein Y032_0015g2718 [Ancylostoma ceylanicum]|uniref:Uncharacterized protein n=1 Tax=Ancylostoma ceylanicum TaxID=53326 RepID=A0A016VA32_9BILA|nr:hypothetical protein Y032_0015g2718 [Ancylostoma ceylanicum]
MRSFLICQPLNTGELGKLRHGEGQWTSFKGHVLHTVAIFEERRHRNRYLPLCLARFWCIRSTAQRSALNRNNISIKIHFIQKVSNQLISDH